MDYKVTFDDGSEALAHFGVKGMKWGVWNDETRARYMGGKIRFRDAFKENLKVAVTGKGKMKTVAERQAEADAAVKGGEPAGGAPVAKGKPTHSPADYDRELASVTTDSTKDYDDHIKAIRNYSDDYLKDEDHWIRLATECINVEYYDSKMSDEDRELTERGLKYGDFNQGHNNSYSIYLHETGKTDAFLKDYNSSKDKFEKNLTERAKKAEEALGGKDSGLAGMLRDEAQEMLWEGLSDKDMFADMFGYEVYAVSGSNDVDTEVLAKAKALMKTAKHSAMDDGSDYLEHYGVLGMKWGVWNDETRRKYFGSLHKAARRLGVDASKTLGKAGSSAAKAIGKAGSSVAAKASEAHAQRVQARHEKAEAERKQKEFDKATRKMYGLSAKKYKKLRNETLRTTDPMKIRKGMHLLTDDELVAKISRIEKEDKVRKSAYVKSEQQAKESAAKAEAFNRSIKGKVVNAVLDKGVNTVIQGTANHVLDKAIKPAIDAYAKPTIDAYAKQGQKAAMDLISKQTAKEQKAAAKAERKAVKKETNEYLKRVKSEQKAADKEYAERERQRDKERADAYFARKAAEEKAASNSNIVGRSDIDKLLSSYDSRATKAVEDVSPSEMNDMREYFKKDRNKW